MTRWMGATLVVLAAVGTGQEASAQPGRGRGGFGGFAGDQVSLLRQKSVQAELKLSDEQIKKAEELAEKRQEAMQGLRDVPKEERKAKFEEQVKSNESTLAGLLKPEQVARLKQISIQQSGGAALANPKVADALKLTDEQKKKVQSTLEDSFEEMREIGQSGNREETRGKIEAARKATTEKLVGLLNAEQQTKWKEMLGSPFTGEIVRGRRNR